MQHVYAYIHTCIRTYICTHVVAHICALFHTAPLYDALLLYAHAATRLLELGGEVDDGLALVKVMENISFEGIKKQPVKVHKWNTPMYMHMQAWVMV